jgi:Cd(II)/Pb(II)-responsive transcriptional regulator
MTNTVLKIGELAKVTGSSPETIRYYEQQGLLPQPIRSEANYRLYGAEHIKRLQFIRHCRSLDMSLDEIQVLLTFRDRPDANCDGVNVLLDKHIGHVAARITELTSLQTQLLQLRAQCTRVRSSRECGILQGLDEADQATGANRGPHGAGCH